MGRKSKLKQNRRAAKMKNNNQESASAPAPVACVVDTDTYTYTGLTTATAVRTGTANTDTVNFDIDDEFPKSDFFLRAEQLCKVGRRKRDSLMNNIRGAVQDGCVHSMGMIAESYLVVGESEDKQNIIHLAHPWILEGAIRGHYMCTKYMLMVSHWKAKPRLPHALRKYWIQMSDKYAEWSGSSIRTGAPKPLMDYAEKTCAMCSNQDAESLFETSTLR